MNTAETLTAVCFIFLGILISFFFELGKKEPEFIEGDEVYLDVAYKKWIRGTRAIVEKDSKLGVTYISFPDSNEREKTFIPSINLKLIDCEQ